jgi:hypothetical protein
MGGLGAPGTRIKRELGPISELVLYVWQATVFALSLDLALALVMCSWLIIGWFAIPLLFGVAGFLITCVVLTFTEASGDKLRFIIGNLWCAGIVVGIVFGMRWHDSTIAGMKAIASQFAVLVESPWWVYVVAGILLMALLILTRSFWLIVGVALIAAIVAVILTSDPRTWLFAWQSLKWLLLPYLWPFIAACLLLALVMAKELLFPSLEWTFKPVSLTELREIGMFGLWMPKRLGGPADEPPPDEKVIKIQQEGQKGNKYATLPGGAEAMEFYNAVKNGEPFAERTASIAGISRSKWQKTIRDVFIARGWACWVDESEHRQGVELLDEGWVAIEHIVLKGTTPTPP